MLLALRSNLIARASFPSNEQRRLCGKRGGCVGAACPLTALSGSTVLPFGTRRACPTRGLRNFVAKGRPASIDAQPEFSQLLLLAVLDKAQRWDGKGGPRCWLDRRETRGDGILLLHRNPNGTRPFDPETQVKKDSRSRWPAPRATPLWLFAANRGGVRSTGGIFGVTHTLALNAEELERWTSSPAYS